MIPNPAFLAWVGRSTFPSCAADAPVLNQPAFLALVAQVGAAARAPGLLPPPFMLERMAAPLPADDRVLIAVLDLPVHVANENAARAMAEHAFTGGPSVDVSSLVEGAQQSYVFAACGLMGEQWAHDVPVFRGRNVSFVLDPRCWLSLSGEPTPDILTLDVGDGSTPRIVRLGDTVTVSYASNVTSVVAALVAHVGTTRRTARFTIGIGGAPVPHPSEEWPLRAEFSDAPALTGHAYVYRAAGNSRLTELHPFIFCEGFPGGYPAAYMYELLDQGGLATRLRASGYDIIVVHLDNGTAAIQQNAQLAIAAIEEAQRRTNAPLIVGGNSMGGLIARYALSWMETHNRPHNARILLTIDSPHLGAFTAPSTQWAARFLAPFSPLAATLAGALGTTANRQFVKLSVDGDRAVVAAEREQFLADLGSVGGWPQRLRRLAVASGQGNGARRFDASGDAELADLAPRDMDAFATPETLRLHGAPFVELRLHESAVSGNAAIVAAGRASLPTPGASVDLQLASDERWELAPGGRNSYTGMAAAIARSLDCGEVVCALPVSCSVPTVSALALEQDPFAPVPLPDSGASPFHDYICCEQDEHHCVITTAVADWIVDRLGSPSSASAPHAIPPAAALDAPLSAPLST